MTAPLRIGSLCREHLEPVPDEVDAQLPTPVVNDMGGGKTPAEWDAWCAEMRARHGNGNGHGNSLAIEAQRVAAAK